LSQRVDLWRIVNVGMEQEGGGKRNVETIEKGFRMIGKGGLVKT